MTLQQYRECSEQFAREHRIRVEERTTMPRGCAAYADWSKRSVVVPPLTDDISFAVRLHEFGHILADDCTNKRPHYRNPKVREWWHCVQCETDAWAIAMRELPFSRAMFRRLQTSLASYRRCTPAHPEAVAAARQIASDGTYAAGVQARAARERRLDAYAEMQAIAADALRPRLRRWERQWQDVQRWAREAR